MTVLIEIAPVGSRGDWVGSFDPVIVPKPERRPGWAAFCSSRPAGDRAQAGAAARGVTGSCSHVSVSSGPRGGSSCTPGRSTASQCLAGMRSAELAQEGWPTGRLQRASMPPDALNPLSGGPPRYACAQRSVIGGCATPRRVCFHAVIGVSVETGEGNIPGPPGRRQCRGHGASYPPLGVLHAEEIRVPS